MIWNAAPCVPATCTAPTAGTACSRVVARCQGKLSRIYFGTDAAFAMPEVYEFLEAERIKYAIRLSANRVLQDRIGYLLKRPVGRRTMCAGVMRASAIRPETGASRAG